MTDCSLIRDLLPMYCDTAVGPESEEIIKEHLDICPMCRNYCRQIQRIPHVLQEPADRGNYRYSEIARSLRRKTMMEYAVGTVLLAAALAGIAHFVLDGRREK